MRHTLSVVAGLLVCLAFAAGVPSHFPPGKTVVYKYRADVKAGVIEPVPFASQFTINGLLKIRHNSNLKNEYYMVLTDLQYALYNGHAVHYEQPEVFYPIPANATMLEAPFLVVFDTDGKLQGMKVMANETGWSMNIKQAIASMIQLDLASMSLQTPLKPHGFLTKEKTIHGKCIVAYDVHTTDQLGPNEFVVTKLHEPKNCTEFVTNVFDNVESNECLVEPEDPMTTASRRLFEIENAGEHIIIKKLIGHGVINYFPWHAKSEAHYLLTNQTMILDKIVSMTDMQLPEVNFDGIEMMNDVSFKKPQGNYALYAGEDLTQGRHHVNMGALITNLKNMLDEAADYLEENHLEMNEPEMKHGQTINRILHTMSYLDVGSFQLAFNAVQNNATHKEVTVRNIFLKMVPQVGTTASCLFTRNLIRKQKVTDSMAISMLGMLPFNVRVPSEKLLSQMEDLIKFEDDVSYEVRKASILCFATMIYKTFKHGNYEIVNPLLDKYVQHFFNHVTSEPNYEMRMLYMQALQNVEVGGVHKILEPIIRGNVSYSEKPDHLRFLAITAAWKSVVHDIQYVHDLYWPILADTKLPLELRIAAYTVLVNQRPHMGRLMNLYWFMVYEKNEHLYNYHYTAMKSLSNTMNPCLFPLKEMVRKILRFTRVRPVTGIFTGHYLFDYEDQNYGQGEMVRMMMMANEQTGRINIGLVEYTSVVMRKPLNKWSLYWRLEGIDHIIKNMLFTEHTTFENVVKVLKKAAQDMPTEKEIHVELSVLCQGRVILTKHYNNDTLKQAMSVINLFGMLKADLKSNWQNIMYDSLYEMQVPTDLGLPAMLTTRVPNVFSLKTNYVFTEEKPMMNIKLEADVRMWSHGYYSMNIYNPIVNVWHDIRRVSSNDMVVPLVMDMGYNIEAKSVKISLPRLPVTRHSITGMLSQVTNYVTISNDEHDLLKKCCATCGHYEIVSKGKTHRKDFTFLDADVKDIGLKYIMTIFDCERNLSPNTRSDELETILSDKNKNTWNNPIAYGIMSLRHGYRNMVISPPLGSCGFLMKVEPSLLYPTSRLDINLRANIENVDHKPMDLISSKIINIHGTLDVKAASTETTVRSWDLNANINMSRNHTENFMQIRVTRTTPGEKNLKICMDGQYIYPVMGSDPLKLGVAKEETNGKLTINMGRTADNQCVRDDATLTLICKGELSDEQKKLYINDKIHGMCARNIENPNYNVGNELIPRTHSCIQEAIRHSTLRKYTYNLTYKNLPQDFTTTMYKMENWLRHSLWANYKHVEANTESGHIDVKVEYPVLSDEVDVTVVNPTHGYKYEALPYGNPQWRILMDNTHFSTAFLQNIQIGSIKFCSIYPKIVTDTDNQTIPMDIPGEWILASGDFVKEQFAIFVKNAGENKLALKIFVHDHSLEVIPTETGPTVNVDGQNIKNYEDGIAIPATDTALRMTWQHPRMMVQSDRLPIQVEWTTGTVTLGFGEHLRGQIAGICGHMDPTHNHGPPTFYRLEQ